MDSFSFTGKALVAAARAAKGAGQVLGWEASNVAQLAGRGLLRSSDVVGRGILPVANTVGKTLIRPFEKENIERTRNNYLKLFSDIGGTIVRANSKGEPKLTVAGFGILGGITMLNKSGDAYRQVKANNLGISDQKPTTATPNYNKVEYEKAPPKRIYPDSGGATGDLVFALHRLR